MFPLLEVDKDCIPFSRKRPAVGSSILSHEPRLSLNPRHQSCETACPSQSILHVAMPPSPYAGHFPFPVDPFTSFLFDELLAIRQVSATTSPGKSSLTVSIKHEYEALTTLGHNCLFTMNYMRAETLPLPPREPLMPQRF